MHYRNGIEPTGEPLLLQHVPTCVPLEVRELYWRVHQDGERGSPSWTQRADGSIAIARSVIVGFDTYFGAFFESPWRLNTRLGTLALRVRASGGGVLRVFRRVGPCTQLLYEAAIDGTAEVRVETPTLNFRQYGMLFFDIVARDGPAVFHEASWAALNTTPDPVALAAVFCTFNREPDIGRVLEMLAAQPAVLRRLSRIIVVNQGRPGLVDHPSVQPAARRLGGLLQVIEQPNFGGAGGFTRGLIEAMDDPALDHVVFLDDDIRLEPDSLLRMAAFMSIARGDVPVGGHMLDGVQPNRLYEAGAVMGDRHWSFHPEHADLDVGNPANLERLGHPGAIQYNGWWCFGFPLHLVQRLGLPMPAFIRGDDTEFGLRLYQAGVPTVSMPGIAVWHEPFYLKLGSWQLYYETRNTLANMAIHRDFGRLGVTRRMARQILIHLMTFRYYSTALILRGIADYLRGPSVLHGNPALLHAGLDEVRERHPVSTLARSTVIGTMVPPRLPRGRLGYLWALTKAIWRNWFTPTPHEGGGPGAPYQRLHVHEFSWVSLARADCVALERWWDLHYPGLCRSRAQFRELLPASLRALWALYRDGPAAQAAWRAEHRSLTSLAFWRDYLGVPAPQDRPVTVPAMAGQPLLSHAVADAWLSRDQS